MAEAKLAKANANVERAQAELEFSKIKAPFDGIIDRLHEQKGSLLEEGAVLTTLSDNQVMWVYFNVTEAGYLEYQEELRKSQDQAGLDIELELANHKLFPTKGAIGAIEADFNNETGNIAFRADFPNPDSILRHGQTGTVLIHHQDHNALVIPQRATFEILAKTYVFVVGDDNAVHQREIKIKHEQDDVFVIESGLMPEDRIVFEGQRQVRDGDKIAFEFESPDSVMTNLKYHAE
ncbi:MAG: efflux RND transporter periplasmic adaptor subunit [Pirellulaceae bacterium]